MIPIIQLRFRYLAYRYLTYRYFTYRYFTNRYLTYRYFIYRYFTYISEIFVKAFIDIETRQLNQIRGPSPARSLTTSPVTRPRWPDWWMAV